MMSDLILFPGPNVDRMSDRFSDPAFCQQNKLMNYFFKNSATMVWIELLKV